MPGAPVRFARSVNYSSTCREGATMPDPFWEGRRVLITGIQGFIGAWLARALIDRGASICGYDRVDRGALDLHPGLRERVSLVLGELTDQTTLESTLASHGIET